MTEAVLLVAEGVLVFAAGVLVRRSPRDGLGSTRFDRVAIVSLLSLAILLPLLVSSDGELARATPGPPPAERISAQGQAVTGHAGLPLPGGMDVRAPRSGSPEGETALSGQRRHVGPGRLVPAVIPPAAP